MIPFSSFAKDIKLSWDANIEPDVAGYNIYYKSGNPGDPNDLSSYDGTGLNRQGETITVSPINVTLVNDENPDIGTVEITLEGINELLAYCFVVTAIDTDGLESSASNEVSTLADTSPPESIATTPSLEDGELISIAWIASDNNSGVASTTLWYAKLADLSPSWADTGLDPQTGTSGTFSFTPPDGDGTYLFATQATDLAGNIEAEPTAPPSDNYESSIAFQTIPTISEGIPGSTTSSSITLDGSIAQGTAIVIVTQIVANKEIPEVKVNVDISDTDWSYNVDTLYPGNNEFEVTALDSLGNESSSTSIIIYYDADGVTPPVILSGDVISHNNAGISDGTRVPDNTSFAVRIKDSDGIDLTLADSVEFDINGTTRDLSDVSVNYSIIAGTEAAATDVWVGYHRASDSEFNNVYDFGESVNISIDANDINGYEMARANFRFKVESQDQNSQAIANLPEAVPVVTGLGDYDSGIEITSGILNGAKVLYNYDEGVTPIFGPINDIPFLDLTVVDEVGAPLNLQPPTIFKIPVTIFIPFSDETNVSDLDLYLYDGQEWVLACNAAGTVQTGGNGWMVPGSRVNHNSSTPDITPSTIEIKALKGAQTHVEGFAPGLATFIRESFDAVERRAKSNPDGLLSGIGTYIFPLMGKIAEIYLDAVGSPELIGDAYLNTTISVTKFNEFNKQGVAVSSHIVKEESK